MDSRPNSSCNQSDLDGDHVAGRRLVVNADDFGLSQGVNGGVYHGYHYGIVTSASLMVRWPATREAAAIARECPRLSVGLHLDLGEWAYRNGQWECVYEVVPLDDASAVTDEVNRQIERFQQLTDRNPTHVDSHQHVHRRPEILRLVVDVARRLRVPLRHLSPNVHYCGDFYGQSNTGESLPESISAAALVRLLARLSPGMHELGCHPASFVDFETMYRDERIAELSALCDARVRSAIETLGIELCRFPEADSIAGGESPLLSRTSGGGDT
ncbi:MAG: ChbG/HpnK family deacetylase [Planctomycetaceae bacterium]